MKFKILGFTCAAALLLTACAPREWLLPKLGLTSPKLRDFPADYKPPLSNETGETMSGFGGGDGGVSHVPVIFIHGNTVSARFWLPARAHFIKAGYSPSELWALSYGWDNVRYFDSDDLSVPSIERIVSSVTAYMSQKTGQPVPQVDIVAHSLGVTLVRQWMKQNNAWHRVRNFIGACGANQGVWTAWPDARGQQRGVSWELAPGSPWLKQLNRGGETPGATRYMMLYDGTGWGDALFPSPHENDSALKGAYNLPFNVKHGTYYGHLELPREPDTMDAMIGFLKQAPDLQPQAESPELLQEDDRIHSDQADAVVRCAKGGDYPSARTPGHPEVMLSEQTLFTCFAHNPQTGLASPMVRYKHGSVKEESETVSLTANPAGGVFENPQNVTLSSNDPEAIIVYTTSGAMPNSGSPLYQEPVYIAGPLTLKAVAIAPDGRRSKPLNLNYDISLEKVEAAHTLQRQFDPAVPEHYEGRRKAGR